MWRVVSCIWLSNLLIITLSIVISANKNSNLLCSFSTPSTNEIFYFSDSFNALSLFFQNKRSNPVWDYFQLDGDKAICKLCNKRLAYKNHMYLTSLSNHLGSKRYGHHQHYLEYVTKKNEILKESDVFNNVFLRLGKRIMDNPDLVNFKHLHNNFINDKWIIHAAGALYFSLFLVLFLDVGFII